MKTISKKINTIILLPLTVIRRVIAVLNFPADIDDFITYANGIHASMTGSAFFAALAAKLATLLTNIGKLQVTHNGLQSNPPTTTTAQRDNDLLVVQNNLRDLKMEVQALADATPAQAEEIIETAGMQVKKFGAINKQDFAAKDGSVSGKVKLVAKASTSPRSAHDWAVSLDGTNWTPVTPTLAATTEIDGLTPGSIVDLRHRTITKDGPTDWLEVNDFVVK
ncbi:MAG: hypothetical protein ACHQNT_03045 [Bacteroidia bacterium]